MLHLPCRRVSFLFCALTLLLTGSAWCGEHKPRSVLWEPYTPDGNTVVLCHFDGRQEKSLNELMELMEEDDDLFGAAELIRAPAQDAGPTTANDVYMKGSTIPLLGACEEVADEGRFGGGLRLTGGDGRVVVSGNPQQGGWTIEASFKAARLPPDRAVLFDLPLGEWSVRVELTAGRRQTPRTAGTPILS